MFKEGDILKVKPEWLSEEEKKNPKYADMEYYVMDCYEGKVKVVCPWEGFTGYLTYTWPDYTMYKVGHIDPEMIKSRLENGRK